MATILERLRSKRTTGAEKLWKQYRDLLAAGDKADPGALEGAMTSLDLSADDLEVHLAAMQEHSRLKAQTAQAAADDKRRLDLEQRLTALEAKRAAFCDPIDLEIRNARREATALAFSAAWSGAPVQARLAELTAKHPALFGEASR